MKQLSRMCIGLILIVGTDNPDYKQRNVDCMTADAYAVIAILACLGTDRLKDAASYFRRISDRTDFPLYELIRKQVLDGHSYSSIAEICGQFLNIFTQLGKQLSITK